MTVKTVFTGRCNTSCKGYLKGSCKGYCDTPCKRYFLYPFMVLAMLAYTIGITAGDVYDGAPFKMEKVRETSFPDYEITIEKTGAVKGGTTLCTEAINKAIEQTSKRGGGRVVIPSGLWLSGPITLLSNVDLHLEKGAIVAFTTDMSQYPIVETTYEGQPARKCLSPLNAKNAENIAITGYGIFDGQGEPWRQLKRDKASVAVWKKVTAIPGGRIVEDRMWRPQEPREELRPNMLKLENCSRILLEGCTFKNSAAWCLHPVMCTDLMIDGIKVMNPSYGQNGDALDVESCNRVVIKDSMFDAGDDGICMKSGKDKAGRDRGMPTQNVVVRNCQVMHGHGGFVIGSEMSGGVRNVWVKNCTFDGTDAGLRFKSTRGRGGVVEKIYVEDIQMLNIMGNALTMDLYYFVKETPGADVPQKDETTPVFRDIHIKNVACLGCKYGMYIKGLPESPFSDITIDNFHTSGNTLPDVIEYVKNVKINGEKF